LGTKKLEGRNIKAFNYIMFFEAVLLRGSSNKKTMINAHYYVQDAFFSFLPLSA
jgi:hypothetical protein